MFFSDVQLNNQNYKNLTEIVLNQHNQGTKEGEKMNQSQNSQLKQNLHQIIYIISALKNNAIIIQSFTQLIEIYIIQEVNNMTHHPTQTPHINVEMQQHYDVGWCAL
eukprot:TRINITY_DN12873_c2_g1_i1.p2 TRINITY_DN12873_c2_g1~~TRINITY_DN12873_c2_g1_i1.p2  ORF type:complete len:107 (+),score=1.47 TRINITY_DN12873_c2_g1_i1:179-499(+)